MKHIHNIGLAAFALTTTLSSCTTHQNSNKAERPNIILIMADDMGFSDIGCYGGEIQTPNLDGLAKTGVRYSQFYNAARCCPTRASLMTGVYPHQAGMGWMTNCDMGTPAYQGDLSKNAATIAEVLKTAGYNTYMTGKWHLSNTRKDKGMVKDNWPVQRGFEHYFGLVGGAGNYFKLPIYSNNEKYQSPDNFYLTNAISDSSAMFIGEHFKTNPDSPMFMYVAYTSPHWPLHALEKDIEKYKNVYNVGWDEIRERRLKKQVELGFWDDQPDLSPRDGVVPSWDALKPVEKKDFARRMAIYAAQVDAMDQGIGRIVSKLRELGQLDNTIIFFLADNGGCAEYISSGKSKDLEGNLEATFESYRINWANASNTPFREYKHWVHEGGVRTPLIVHWPEGISASMEDGFVRNYGHLTDIMATCVELSGAHFPDTINGNPIVPMQGSSLVPHFTGQKNGRGPIFWEHEANIGMRDGVWKLVAKTPENKTFNTKRLELYNIEEDPTELNNLAGKYPEKLGEMYAEWKIWAEKVGVYPMDTRDYGERSRAYQQKINGEFDLNYGDWDINNPDGKAEFLIDQNSKISGKNSAFIKISKEKGKASLIWGFPSGDYNQFEVSFKSVASCDTKLVVRFEKMGKSNSEGLKYEFPLSAKESTFSFISNSIDQPGRYRLIFEVDNVPVNEKVWLDNIELTPVELM
ncbi:arylsulfatase [Sunxiuqinia sp. A32]|uniref:arylsulfatase n=1 Tax=Sunxiuqinia sp. A32 TaxID=3461496 RepID=UPI004045C1B9